MTGLLSHDDLVELTEYRRPADQRRWLDARGIPYYTGASGRPKVLWADLAHHQASRATEPDWSALPKAG